MININDLENRWHKYKIKSYIPYISITISILLIATILFVLLNKNTFFSEKEQSNQKPTINIEKKNLKTVAQNKKNITKETNTTKEKEIEIKENIAKVSKETKISQDKKLILAPSLDFMKEMYGDMTPFYNNQKSNTPKKEISKISQVKNKPIQKKHITKPKIKVAVKKTIIKKPRYKSINIKRKNTYKDIEHVITRFKKNNSPALSLFIAKKYYELKEYRNSYNYALITNKINNNIETSWLIFAKSLVKLNKKDNAIKTLKQYIKHSKSNKAEALLDEIESGKFK